MKYKGIIFDLDGVIISTDKFHYLAWKQIADKIEIPFNIDDNNRLRGVSRMEPLEIILSLGNRTMSDNEKRALTEEKNIIYKRMLDGFSPAVVAPEVIETLSLLKKRSIKTAIGSSSRNAEFILEKIGLAAAFDAISSGANITKTKPDPEVFNNAAVMLGMKNRDILVVEDSRAGIDAAERGGFDSAGIGNAFNAKNAVYHIKNLTELLSLNY